ncbi:hypothetical protein SLA2020_356510 [Shorea laevis]
MARTMEEITSPEKPVAATSSHGFPRKSALMRKKETERRMSDIMCEVGGKSRSCAGIGCFSETLDLTPKRRCFVSKGRGEMLSVGGLEHEALWMRKRARHFG